MKSCRLIASFAFGVLLTAPGVSQRQTLARLGSETHADVSHEEVYNPASIRPHERPSYAPAARARATRTSAAARAAAEALFVKSDLRGARLLSERALRHDPQDFEALFVRMEVAGIEADDSATLDAAVGLCEAGAVAPSDPRVQLAATRVREAAANTPEFRRVMPRLQALVAKVPASSFTLQIALLNAAMDGLANLDPNAIAHSVGILTDWRIVGPLGSHPLADTPRPLISSNDDLAQNSYFGHPTENFQFADGWVRLPNYFARRGVFYAASDFASLSAATWKVNLEGATPLAMYVDGQRVHWTESAPGHRTGTLELAAGPHRVMVEFAGASTPLRVTFAEAHEEERVPLRPNLSLAEATYLLAAEHYSGDDFAAAIRQVDAVAATNGVALQSLRAESWSRQAPASREATTAWQNLHSEFPEALAADDALSAVALSHGDRAAAVQLARTLLARHPSNVKALETITQAVNKGADTDAENWWARRLAAHPSCTALHGAVSFYAARGLAAEKQGVRQKLDGCAPESLDSARSLSEEGNHAEAAHALEGLLAAAPLNREARLMLVRELQLSGDDADAQAAAADWLKIAPNAENYHRLAAAVSTEDRGAKTSARPDGFYAPYRRDAAVIERSMASAADAHESVVLIEDHVALARADGSVSLYVHTARRLLTQQVIERLGLPAIPDDAQVVKLRVLHPDGTTSELNATARQEYASLLSPGDTIDLEYVLHFAGDGGIPEHAEAFQFVFGSFDDPVLNARFVVLTPGDRADGGVVIATGEPPPMRALVHDGMLERVWEKSVTQDATDGSSSAQGIVRVVEQENGWTVPSNAERQRRIETIHPGPRPQDS